MPMSIETVQKIIEDAIPEAEVMIEDLRGDGDHYSAHVVSPAFEGKSRIEQHKMVQSAFGDRLGTELHALAIQTSTPKS